MRSMTILCSVVLDGLGEAGDKKSPDKGAIYYLNLNNFSTDGFEWPDLPLALRLLFT